MKKRPSFTRAARIVSGNPTKAQIEAAGWARLVGHHGPDFQFGGIRRGMFGGLYSHHAVGIYCEPDQSMVRQHVSRCHPHLAQRVIAARWTKEEGFKVL